MQRRRWCWLLGALVLTLSFQNCSGGFQGVVDEASFSSQGLNRPPIVSAGSDLFFSGTSYNVPISATATDPDGVIVSVQWMQMSGPIQADLSGDKTLHLNATNLVPGTYDFRVLVTDDSGNSAFDDVAVIVSAPNNVLPVVNAGADKTVQLPAVSAALTGTATDSDGSIASVQWSQVSGPNTATISPPTTLGTSVSGLVPGDYVFQLKATDNIGGVGVDTVKVTVLAPVYACADEPMIKSAFAFVGGKANKTWSHINGQTGKFPRGSDANGVWALGGRTFDTSAFYPGIYWLLHKYSPSSGWKTKADFFTDQMNGLKVLEPNPYNPSDTAYLNIDLGFQFQTTYIQRESLTSSAPLRDEIMRAAKDLASVYVAGIKGIPSRGTSAFTEYDLKIDHLMNLEILLWGARKGGPANLKTVAVQHGLTTLNHFIRPDGGTFHLVRINKNTGAVTKKHTTQGYADSSTWARGQAWAIYGFTMLYRETMDTRFRDAAVKTADYFLARLPASQVPPWDFNVPASVDPNPPKDTSASAIVASALFELAALAPANKQDGYLQAAKRIMKALINNELTTRSSDMGVLWNAVGHKPNNREVGVSLPTGDYFFTEALLRWNSLCQAK